MLSGWDSNSIPNLIQFAPLPAAGILIGSKPIKNPSSNIQTQRPTVSMRILRSPLPTKRLPPQASDTTGTHGPEPPTSHSPMLRESLETASRPSSGPKINELLSILRAEDNKMK